VAARAGDRVRLGSSPLASAEGFLYDGVFGVSSDEHLRTGGLTTGSRFMIETILRWLSGVVLCVGCLGYAVPHGVAGVGGVAGVERSEPPDEPAAGDGVAGGGPTNASRRCPPTASHPLGAGERDWPMLAHDAARSGATAAEIRPPFARKWYRLFPDEGLMAGVQPVVAEGKVFVGTMRGVLHAIDAETGKDLWAYKAGGAILHASAVADGKVFFGCADGSLYALRASDGQPLWEFPTGAAVWNSPLPHDDAVLIGSRDGNLYAVVSATGKLRWKAATGGPLLSSPALDVRAGRVYVASEDMHVYACELSSGRLVWRSEKLPGVSFRGYHPVIAPDGSVMITVTPALSLDAITPILDDMVKEIFGDYASWRHNKEENEKLRAENFKLMEKPETYRAQLDYLRRRLAAQPAYQTFFVLDPQSGKQKFVAPIVYAESMNGTGVPPVVTPEGKVIVKYQALLRSRYQHYSPFLNVGYLNTETGDVTPIMDQSRTYGWHDSLLLVHDEQCQLSVAGRVLINTHQDNVNAMDLDTLQGCGEPFCRNIHEPQPGEAVGIWVRLLRGETLPPGKEWLARGTAVYGGGSVIDVPVTIAGDSFYYLPTHEVNAGAALIAYKMHGGGGYVRMPYPPAASGQVAQPAKPPADQLTEEQWQKVRQLPWDWDTLGMPRLSHVLKALPEMIPGSRQLPLSEQARATVATIPDADLDRFIWEAPVLRAAGDTDPARLRDTLSECVKELISRRWRPLVFPAGKHPGEAYRFFAEPTETLYTLARAHRHLDAELQREVRRYVEEMAAPGGGGPSEGSSQGLLGRRTYDPSEGQVRSLYDVPPEQLMRVQDDITRSEVARLYPLWLWAYTTGDWSNLERDWRQLSGLVSAAPNKLEEDCRNGHVAGLIAYCRIAAHLRDEAAVARGLAAARESIRQRLQYELAYPRGGLILTVPTLRSIFARWRHLTPEVGRLCAAYARDTQRHLMDVYVDYHRPTWPLAWNVETMWRNETPFQFPTAAAEVFAARALILGEPAEKLARFVDIPWCKADLFYVEKVVFCLEAGEKTAWRDVRRPAGRGSQGL
jgi:hypothetical protein